MKLPHCYLRKEHRIIFVEIYNTKLPRLRFLCFRKTLRKVKIMLSGVEKFRFVTFCSIKYFIIYYKKSSAMIFQNCKTLLCSYADCLWMYVLYICICRLIVAQISVQIDKNEATQESKLSYIIEKIWKQQNVVISKLEIDLEITFIFGLLSFRL